MSNFIPYAQRPGARDVYTAIREHIAEHGSGPSTKQIAVRSGLKCPVVAYALTMLEVAGYIRRAHTNVRETGQRGVALTGKPFPGGDA